MGNMLFETIRRLGIFMICAQMIVHLKPNESYEKYLKLLMSIMVMVQIIFPIMQLLGSEWDGARFSDRVRDYGKAMQGEKSSADLSDAADEIVEKYTMREIDSRLVQQAQENGAENGSGNEEDGRTGDAALPEDAGEVERIVIDRIEVD